MKTKETLGMKFGRLTHIAYGAGGNRKFCVFRCDCGTEKIANRYAVITGNTKSCGCLMLEYQQAGTVRTHGLHKSPEYRSWTAMKQRCTNKNDPGAKNYQNRGITFCERWDDFEMFYKDMGPRPSLAHTLDRIDNDKGYFPSNCRWGTKLEQQRNRRTSRLLTFEGETKTIHEWAKIKGISSPALYKRINRGWTVEDALTTPPVPEHMRGEANRNI